MSRYARFKTSKTEAQDQGWYTIFNSPGLTRPSWGKQIEMYQVASIDPATNNFALRIEKRFTNGAVIPIVFEKVSFKAEDPIGTNLVYSRATAFILKHLKDLQECHYIFSERQLPQNYKAVRISTHILGLLLVLTQKPIILEVNSRLKGYQLGSPKGLTERQLKQWSVQEAEQILKQRNDTASLEVLCKNKKKDDLSDTVCQAEAVIDFLKLIPKVKKLVIRSLKPQTDLVCRSQFTVENRPEGRKKILRIKNVSL